MIFVLIMIYEWPCDQLRLRWAAREQRIFHHLRAAVENQHRQQFDSKSTMKNAHGTAEMVIGSLIWASPSHLAQILIARTAHQLTTPRIHCKHKSAVRIICIHAATASQIDGSIIRFAQISFIIRFSVQWAHAIYSLCS